MGPGDSVSLGGALKEAVIIRQRVDFLCGQSIFIFVLYDFGYFNYF